MRTNFYASKNLRRLYEERVGDSMTQAEFARRYEIGGQTMLSQIISGSKPLPIDAAQKLAKALHCSIYDICPKMGDYINDVLVPALGKGLRRAAALMLAFLTPSLFVPPDANAAIGHNVSYAQVRQVHDLITHCLRKLLSWLRGPVFCS